MTRIFSALLLALAASLAGAADPVPLQVADNAPERHIVVPGDTLWGISARFLKEPWRWPEVWRLNSEQIKNPHRIYPGDVIVLGYDGSGKPLLRVAGPARLSPKVSSEKLDEAIPSIPSNAITPFLSKPLIVENDSTQSVPRIVALQEERGYVGLGDIAYATGISSGERRWNIYRPGKAILDPETKEPLGYEAFYLGNAELFEPGEPGGLRITASTQEIGKGDWLAPAAEPKPINYAPHRPDHDIDARVVSVYGGVGFAGTHSVVAINRGRNDGVEVGHVLALNRNRTDSYIDPETRVRQTVQVPPERFGLLFVFRTFDRIAYAFVLNAAGKVSINDFVATP